ncbi:hypothetical protein AB1Y20_003628 [Prymnesium parvum]|uniref:Tubulin--tyrosine ligase-like protein 9 n=1 Tax=Prymnesium parvum TaxID=97485 RepID=A0AB34J7M5_PRYPA
MSSARAASRPHAPDDDGGGRVAEPLILRTSERVPPLVVDVFEAKGFREQEEDTENWHVHWKAGRFKPSEYAAANAAQRVNHFPKTTGITKKDTLLRNLRRMRGVHGQIFNFFPESYILPTEYMTLVRTCEQRPEEKPVWILKPTDSSQGRKIFLIRDLSEISYGHFSDAMRAELLDEPREADERRDPRLDEKGRAIATDLDMATTLRMLKSRLHKTVTPCVKFTEMHIVQRYLERPLCFHGYKLDLRIYVLLLSAVPLRVYTYRDCLVRFATQKYDLNDLGNTYSHLTNTSINKNSASYNTVKDGIRGGCKWSLLAFIRENPTHPLNSPLLWCRIRAIINLTLLSIADSIPDNGGCFELLGYDIIIDEQLRPWLLEVNTSPALGVECDVDREVKEPLLADLIDLLALQRPRNAAAACPAGGGVRAAKARGWPTSGGGRGGEAGRGSGGGGGGGGGVAEGGGGGVIGRSIAATRTGERERQAEVMRLPEKVGGYELIFPFNAATAKLAPKIGGNEALVVGEIKAELQAAAAAAAQSGDVSATIGRAAAPAGAEAARLRRERITSASSVHPGRVRPRSSVRRSAGHNSGSGSGPSGWPLLCTLLHPGHGGGAGASCYDACMPAVRATASSNA